MVTKLKKRGNYFRKLHYFIQRVLNYNTVFIFSADQLYHKIGVFRPKTYAKCNSFVKNYELLIFYKCNN